MLDELDRYINCWHPLEHTYQYQFLSVYFHDILINEQVEQKHETNKQKCKTGY